LIGALRKNGLIIFARKVKFRAKSLQKDEREFEGSKADQFVWAKFNSNSESST
jgi:hypothetical protein